ncbi:hypothetical protein FLAG1_10333 [Fusarium langsethiae]|uniref:Ubiquitin-like protease family profile domain-containing protein n=1 Tax=Fusarium langsethiae TaxID=179993 RepID=A0A0N0DBL9_FUSLA|nr:hypothetical protein FLAG1_10333 [Fusarium langsethiae]
MPSTKEPDLLMFLFECLKSNHEWEQLSQELVLRLPQCSVVEQQQLRSFAQRLLSVCNNLLGENGSPSTESFDAIANEPAYEHDDKDESQDSKHEVGVATELDVRHPECSHISPLDSETANTGDPFCRASFRHSTPDRKGKSTSSSKVAPLSSTIRARPLGSSPERSTETELMTPEPTPIRVPSRASLESPAPTIAKDTCYSLCDSLINQTTDSFVRESYEAVERFSFADSSQETNKAVLASIRHRMKQHHNGNMSWSDGSQFVFRLDVGNGMRDKGPVWGAISAIDFVGWHKSQVQLLLSDTKTAQEATQEVSERVIRCKLGVKDENNEKEWERNRKRLNTDLARGRKWSRLAEDLGLGILFKDVWGLGKSKESDLKKLTKDLVSNREKMIVLSLLDQQMDIFSQTGKTDLGNFRKSLEVEGLASSILPVPPTNLKLHDILHKQVRARIQGDKLIVKGTDFGVDVDSLKRLSGTTWLNDEIILACLHLSDKSPFVRVGFSIPIYQTDEPGNIMPRPFQRASSKMREWRNLNGKDDPLIGIFPLNLHNRHFTLLEINERAECILHYDSQSDANHKDIEEACRKEFPSLRYMEMKSMRQVDGHSCGPLVIKQARRRMMGQSAISTIEEDYDPDEMRVEAASLLNSALEEGGLIAALGGRKRKGQTKANRRSKRLQIGALDLDYSILSQADYAMID